jgi:hypothetical protein
MLRVITVETVTERNLGSILEFSHRFERLNKEQSSLGEKLSTEENGVKKIKNENLALYWTAIKDIEKEMKDLMKEMSEGILGVNWFLLIGRPTDEKRRESIKKVTNELLHKLELDYLMFFEITFCLV